MHIDLKELVLKKEKLLLTMADMILTNGKAGLIDLNLNQKQMVQNAGCSPIVSK